MEKENQLAIMASSLKESLSRWLCESPIKDIKDLKNFKADNFKWDGKNFVKKINFEILSISTINNSINPNLSQSFSYV